MQCCPLPEADEFCDVWNETRPTAKKAHRCEECRENIEVGSKYQRVESLFDGHWETTKTCLLCVELREHFSCGRSTIMGELWASLEESFFPDMKAGGPCIAGLSPEAKNKLFTKRMEWIHSHGAGLGRVALPPQLQHLSPRKPELTQDWQLLSCADELDQCCVAISGVRCTKPTLWKITGETREDPAYTCSEHVRLVRDFDEVIEEVNFRSKPF